ncbi:MAG: hypothetical protein EBU08_03620 [Micrococcales bacterium]|nr:hypothetical protein [Micrococcales bacterium]
MGKPRPTEIKLVAKLLDPDAENSEDASALAIEITDWAPLQAWGEFSTKLQAEKFFPHLSSPDKSGGKGAIAKLANPDEFLKMIGDK